MLYSEYKIAAERHLETCYHLSIKVQEIELKKIGSQISLRELDNQRNLLSNLYYLSGYMVECLYSYAMCKNEHNNPNPINGNVKDVLDRADRGTYNLCFLESKRTNQGVRYSIARPKHSMSLSELSYFTVHGTGTLAVAIPLLDNITELSTPDLQNLFTNWSAYERYKINHFDHTSFPDFTIENVVNFFWELVDVCAMMSEHILREQTLFSKIILKR